MKSNDPESCRVFQTESDGIACHNETIGTIEQEATLSERDAPATAPENFAHMQRGNVVFEPCIFPASCVVQQEEDADFSSEETSSVELSTSNASVTSQNYQRSRHIETSLENNEKKNITQETKDDQMFISTPESTGSSTSVDVDPHNQALQGSKIPLNCHEKPCQKKKAKQRASLRSSRKNMASVNQ